METVVHAASSPLTKAADETGMLVNLLANLDGVVYRCRIDDSWTMEFLSEGCQALTGYAVEDLLHNRRVSYDSITFPEDRAHVHAVIQESLGAGGRFSLEYRILRQDGGIRWVWERGIGIRNAMGIPVAIEGIIQDITQRKEAEQALHEAERRFRNIFENTVEGIFQSTPEKGYLAVNPALAHMYGYDGPADMIAHLRDIELQLYVDPLRRAEFLRLMDEQEGVTNFESQVYHRSGKIIWISENARTVRNSDQSILFFEGTVIDITERKINEDRVHHQATHDALTGLPNRNLLVDRLEQAILLAMRQREQAAVVLIDLDQFKFVNDSLGHQAGDELLKIIGRRLASCIRTTDTVARHGGDEFVLVLSGFHQDDALAETLQRIVTAIAEPLTLSGFEMQVTCSVGVSLYPQDGADAQALLRNADAAMYKAKDLGRDTVEYFSAEMNSHATLRFELLNSLRSAIANNEFLLHYQPKINLANGRLVGAEALIRWRHPVRGMVSPAEFIPIAEDSGLIIAIGEWVLRSACAQNVEWQRAGLPPIPISVNLSARQLAKGNIVGVVANVLADTGLAPCYLELEITETMVMRDVDKSLKTLIELKQLGVSISIDDFGTGYSSLNYLKRFPVDTLKIDRSFVNDIAIDQDDAAIVKAVISLAHILNLTVVAEGVETREQVAFLTVNGCHAGQGYLFGKPMPHDGFQEKFLATPHTPPAG
ncbi:MAG TPA: EAL domain-containing protein [Noviherbaspirillum sp.]|uniref:putative bifunctional diguanylate cyclase/phosphodiesterase n=1 Tax=Noviherbaspirillum sp. TaxID=1926288 RepID=UPI002DDCBA8D|nr:EAL domain-containing protein [Noviherbaspirillum sp.]HEV2610416.1 EAL domain-containing protein [Noviherbaspirillum sp.]